MIPSTYAAGKYRLNFHRFTNPATTTPRKISRMLCKHLESKSSNLTSSISQTSHTRHNAKMAPSLEPPESVEDVLSNPLKAAPKLVAPEPEHCPGPESQQAGQGDACQTCPNKEICASAPKGPDPDIPAITERLLDVKHKILVRHLLLRPQT